MSDEGCCAVKRSWISHRLMLIDRRLWRPVSTVYGWIYFKTPLGSEGRFPYWRLRAAVREHLWSVICGHSIFSRCAWTGALIYLGLYRPKFYGGPEETP